MSTAQRRCLYTEEVQCTHFVALMGMVERQAGNAAAPATDYMTLEDT